MSPERMQGGQKGNQNRQQNWSSRTKHSSRNYVAVEQSAEAKTENQGTSQTNTKPTNQTTTKRRTQKAHGIPVCFTESDASIGSLWGPLTASEAYLQAVFSEGKMN